MPIAARASREIPSPLTLPLVLRTYLSHHYAKNCTFTRRSSGTHLRQIFEFSIISHNRRQIFVWNKKCQRFPVHVCKSGGDSMKTLFCRVLLVCLAVLLIAGASIAQVQDNTTGSGNWSAPA